MFFFLKASPMLGFLFRLFTPLRVGGRPHRRLFWPTQTHIQKIIQNSKTLFFFPQCFYNVFRRKHRNLRGFRPKVGPFCSVFNALASKNVQFRDLPKPLKTPLFTLFSSIFPCANAARQLKTYIQKIIQIQKHCFFSMFLHFFRQQRRNLHVFRLKVGPKHWFLQCFQCSGIQKPFKISLFIVFFHFCPFFPLPEADQNDPKFRFNGLLSSDTQKSSKKRANTTLPRSRCEIVFEGPPPLKLI